MDLIEFARSLWDFPARRRYRAALARRAFSLPAGRPVLAFGEAGPAAGGLIHGGRVKLGHLADRFAHDEFSFNTLYLVSSAIPPHARELIEWARGRGAKLVWNQNGVGFPAWARGASNHVNRPMRELMRRADFVVYQSEFCRQSAEHFLGPAPGRAAVLFNPVDLARFAPAPEPPPLDCWRLLAAGTHNQSGRVLGAIEALATLRHRSRCAHLTVAGRLNWPGAEREVHAAIQRHGLADAIDLRASFSQAEAAALLCASHVLLHAKYHDPCPTMVIEALSCGVPVVGSRSGGMPELVSEECGQLIAVPLSWEQAAYPQPEELADAVEAIMAAWADNSRAARARAERLFSREHWLVEHARIFTELHAL